MASLLSNAPGLVWLSTNKALVFGFAAFMLTLSGVAQIKARSLPCPIDKKDTCTLSKKIGLFTYLFSLVIFSVSGFFAFVAPKFL